MNERTARAAGGIHPTASIAATAVVADTAQIGANTTVGAYTVVEDEVVVGDGCQIGHHVVLLRGSHLGSAVRVDEHTVIGKQPMKAANSAVTKEAELDPARVGDGCLIGASAVVYAGCELGERVLVADLATIRENVTIGDKTIVGRGAAVENHCRVGAFCKLETNAYITAYSELEDRVFVAPGVLTSNDNYIGRTEERFQHFKGATIRKGGRIGVGAVLLPGVEVGADAVVAAGAVQTGDAEGGMIYAGLPARPFRAVPDEQKLENQGW